MKKNLIKKVKSLFKEMRTLPEQPRPVAYRVIAIDKQQGQNIATIQVIGKNVVFKAKPEDILADNDMTTQFSSTDVRNLTYLGYDDINQPQYQILAKQQDDHDETVYAMRKRGEKDVQIKTAAQISNDPELLRSIDQEDAHMVGYTAATEKNLAEEKAKAEARKALEKENNKKQNRPTE